MIPSSTAVCCAFFSPVRFCFGNPTQYLYFLSACLSSFYCKIFVLSLKFQIPRYLKNCETHYRGEEYLLLATFLLDLALYLYISISQYLYISISLYLNISISLYNYISIFQNYILSIIPIDIFFLLKTILRTDRQTDTCET